MSSNPFRVHVHSNTRDPSRRAGRSLESLATAPKGRSNRNNMFHKRPQEPPRPPPSPKSKFAPGTVEWLRERAEKRVPFHSSEYTPDFILRMSPEELADYRERYIPTAFPAPPPTYRNPYEIALEKGWELHEEDRYCDNGEFYRTDVFWTHPKYEPSPWDTPQVKSRRFRTGIIEYDGNSYYVPLATNDEDPLGIGFCFEVNYGRGTSHLRNNEWTNYWNTRYGKKRARYLDRLKDKREAQHIVEEYERRHLHSAQ